MKRPIIALATALSCIALPSSLSAQEGRARPANCLLVVEGVQLITGKCLFTPQDRDGSFQINGANGKFFAMVQVESKGVGIGYWNGEPYASHAHNPLGTLHREDGCWVNDTASVCAY